MKLQAQSKKIISEFVSIPTASFHEHKVIGRALKFCLKNGFKLKQDESGNILIRYKKGRALQPVILMAHMDHPGFEVLKAAGRKAEVGIMGGVNLNHFKKAKIVVSTPRGLVKGRIIGKTGRRWMGKPVFKVRLSHEVNKGDFGYYDLPGIRFKGGEIHTKSADNLAGVALLLDLLLRLKKGRAHVDVTVLLTRAEEVGFIGCISVVDRETLKKDIPIIVVEASSAKAGGVRINGGPVIRVGDKQSGFSPMIDSWLQMVAEVLLKKSKKFKYQRALLSGGRCEASALMLKGCTVGGIAFPLGNYHNNGKRTYAPEYIGINDYNNALEFFYCLAQAPRYKSAYAKKKKELWKNYGKWRQKL